MDGQLRQVLCGSGLNGDGRCRDHNLSGTTLANKVTRADFAGSFQFRDPSGTLSGIDVGDVFKDLDGSRRARLRYDTPSFSGCTAGAAYGINALSSGNGSYVYGNVGYGGSWLSIGDTAFSVDFYRGTDFESSGSSSDSWGVGVTQDFDAQSIEAYLGYIQYGFSDAAISYADLTSITFGARWRF
ncbi:MAG: hypothetical protein HRU32_04130 [Rhodobacteraceae bacterium]|nr:hypothetical protein [Paracoccaceae bacterium]